MMMYMLFSDTKPHVSTLSHINCNKQNTSNKETP